MGLFFIKCKEAGHVCDKYQYEEASITEKIKLKIHLMYCSACRKHSASNKKLSQLLNKIKFQFLSSEEKDNIKKSFEKELKKHQQ
ncbi:hypothetical protein [Mesoflavibacter zeaxanthinifaciens]|uniref:hypothetical protein n=1 Tax=Mesoflavibacter zeaxanthinifaciens TaxID=393060 RepID=UPI000419235F|nr:hypothetical protein [Mesoflavibacter zeaxanthinifaciens]